MPTRRAAGRLGRYIRNVSCFVALVLSSSLVYGQKKATPAAAPPQPTPMPTALPSEFDQTKLAVDSNGKPIPEKAKEDNCFVPPLNGVPMVTAGATGLQVPAKTQREFDQGCTALRNKKAADAENHLRKALKQNAKFSAAWVLLGQVLEAEQKMDDARD